jgi:DNA-binding XRE family transcriptional regulator
MQRLKEERLKAGLTQKQLAELVGTSDRTISSIETGKYHSSNGYYCGLHLRIEIKKVLKKLRHSDFKIKEDKE